MTPQESARRVLGLMDLTSLNDADSPASTRRLAAAAATPFGAPAALCVYARFVPTARTALDALRLNAVRVAAVANFPAGSVDAKVAAREVATALALGADEVDVVFPWRALQAGDAQSGERLVAACKAALAAAGRPACRLKVILETGELRAPELIREASRIAIAAGADFIKTSTGKVPINATLEAAELMLEAIRDAGGKVGFKAAGGVRTLEEAEAYLALADRAMGPGWAAPGTFRFGASGLLGALLAVLSAGAAGSDAPVPPAPPAPNGAH